MRMRGPPTRTISYRLPVFQAMESCWGSRIRLAVARRDAALAVPGLSKETRHQLVENGKTREELRRIVDPGAKAVLRTISLRCLEQ